MGSADFYGPDEAVDRAEDEIFERVEAEHREQEHRLLQPVRRGQRASRGQRAHPYPANRISAKSKPQRFYDKLYWAPSRVEHRMFVREFFVPDYDDLAPGAYRDPSPTSDPGFVTDRSIEFSDKSDGYSRTDFGETGESELSHSSGDGGRERDVSSGDARETSVEA